MVVSQVLYLPCVRKMLYGLMKVYLQIVSAVSGIYTPGCLLVVFIHSYALDLTLDKNVARHLPVSKQEIVSK